MCLCICKGSYGPLHRGILGSIKEKKNIVSKRFEIKNKESAAVSPNL